MDLKNWYEIIQIDFPEIKVQTSEDIERVRGYSRRFRSLVRWAMEEFGLVRIMKRVGRGF